VRERTIIGRAGSYGVGDLVAENETYRLYLCKQEETGRECLLQVPINTSHNGDLDRAGFFLKQFERRALELEEEYKTVKDDPKKVLNYQLGFPELLEGFVCQEHGGRRINILAFRNVEKVNNLSPLTFITERDQRRIDLRTSVWIMGKLLKLLTFAHSQGIAVCELTSGNILIEPKEHYVLIFDWSVARAFQKGVPDKECGNDISQAARAVIEVMGGDFETSTFHEDDNKAFKHPYETGKGFDLYTAHILRLASGSERNAGKAHQNFYNLVDELWEGAYHPFTSYPLTLT